jgi:hypothetical protein
MKNKNGTEYDQKWLKHQHDNMFSQFACGLGYPPLWIHAYSISCASVNAFQISMRRPMGSSFIFMHHWSDVWQVLRSLLAKPIFNFEKDHFLCPPIMSFQGGSFVCIFNLFLLNNELWLLTQIVVATINNQLSKFLYAF